MGVTHALKVQSQALIDIIERLLANMGISVMGYRDAAVKLRELGLLNDDEGVSIPAISNRVQEHCDS